MRLGDIKVGQKVRRIGVSEYGPQDIGVVRGVLLNTQSVDVLYPSMGGWVSYPQNLELVEDVSPTTQKNLLPTDATERKKYPVATGVLDYFPSAILASGLCFLSRQRAAQSWAALALGSGEIHRPGRHDYPPFHGAHGIGG